MKSIIISPHSAWLANNKPNPKNYPWWGEVVALLKANNLHTIQIGVTNEAKIYNIDEYHQDLSFQQLDELLDKAVTWISGDNFWQHHCKWKGKPGVVIFSLSDPVIYGHPENINLLKDRQYLRANQYAVWIESDYNKDAFVTPEEVVKAVMLFV